MKGPNPTLTAARPPIMRQTAHELRRLLELRATRTPQLQQVLLSDPAAAIAVFRKLEQTRPGAFEQVADAAHAISMIGQDAFRHLLDELPEIDGDIQQPGSPPAATAAYSQAAQAAAYAESLAVHRGIGDGKDIPTAALLQNPAVLALWAIDPESAQRATNAARQGVSFSEAFGAELGEPLEQANRRLARAWALPSLARQAMEDWDDFNIRPRIVKLGDSVATPVGGDTEMVMALLAEFLHISDDAATAWLHEQAAEAARRLAHMHYPLQAFDLLLLPGELPEEEDPRIPVMGAWRERRAEPASTTPAKTPDLHATMADVMKRIRQQAGARRVMFAMLSKDRRRLRTRLALGGKANDGIRQLDLGLGEKNLFSALMGKPQSVWLNRGNAGRYRAYLPDSLRKVLGAHGAFVMSLYIQDKPLGLMYGDGDALDENGYRRFRDLCQEATEALGAGSQHGTGMQIPQTSAR